MSTQAHEHHRERNSSADQLPSAVAFDAIRVFVGAGAALYLLFSAAVFLRYRESLGVGVPALVLGFAVALGGCWAATRTGWGSSLVRRHALAMAVGIAVVAASIPFVFMVATQTAYPAIGLIVVMLCVAATIHHHGAAVVLLALCDAGWIAGAAAYGLGEKRWSVFLTEVVMVNAGATLVHLAGTRTARRLDAARREVAVLAGTDDLTGLANCRRVHEVGGSLLERLGPGEGLVLAFLDVDGLKALNDHAGHQEGDRLLVAFADALRSAVRPGDLVGRIGGDEFVVLALGPDRAEAEHLVDRLRLAIGTSGLGASIGSAWAEGPAPTGVDFAELLATADHAMYADKRARRATGGVDGPVPSAPPELEALPTTS